MKSSVEAHCIVCQLVFCCGDCRWKHEQTTHGLTYDCPICRGKRFLCRPEELNEDFIQHLATNHLPLQCRKCNKYFVKMEDLVDIDKCTSISELVEQEVEVKKEINIDEKFDSIYKKATTEEENFEAIVSVNNTTKTAVITPIVRKKHLVDYESSESESEDSPKKDIMITPHPKMTAKTPKQKSQRTNTPHVKKVMGLIRQKLVEEFEETDDNDYDRSSINNRTTPLRSENVAIKGADEDMTTPTSHLPNLLKLAQTVTTSTPTHPATGTWSIFPGPGTDSPLSEIETTDSPAQSIDKEPSKSEEKIPPKLKSIIVVGSRLKLGSQDSTEKQVTFQDITNNTESSVKTKKVKFAEDTRFEQEPKMKRVFRKPKRMLTPGPQRPRFTNNPRFQALLNRFESQAMTLARTPLNTKEPKEKVIENTPPAGDHNIPARAISFKDDSPVVESESQSKESNELFKTCVDTPIRPINNAITTLTSNIAGSLQTCLTSVLRSTDEETEIQFKFVITKKKVSVKRMEDGEYEALTEMKTDETTNQDNIWSTVARAVKNVFWGNPETPYCEHSNDSTSSSASKRKIEDMSDTDISPLNHKRHKYEGKIRGRPPLRRSRPCGVSSLRSSHSAEQHSLLKEMSINQENEMNLSF